MNRLHTLREVLPRNLEDNRHYSKLEWLLLDYNSSDGLEDWVATEMREHIESGLLTYCRTTQPQYYSMTHSRNLAFKLASGAIVHNVDADNYTNHGFAPYLNRLANQCPERAVFAKGMRLLRGRLGFYRRDFIDILGGYDEDLKGYGHDDRDLFERAMHSGFTLLWFGGRFVDRIRTPRSVVGQNMQNRNWRETETRNKAISEASIRAGRYRANGGRRWGCGTVTKNFAK
jgi:hypothetical protein